MAVQGAEDPLQPIQGVQSKEAFYGHDEGNDLLLRENRSGSDIVMRHTRVTTQRRLSFMRLLSKLHTVVFNARRKM